METNLFRVNLTYEPKDLVLDKEAIKKLMDFIPEDLSDIKQRTDQTGVLFYSDKSNDRYIIENDSLLMDRRNIDLASFDLKNIQQILSEVSVHNLVSLEALYIEIEKTNYNTSEKINKFISEDFKNVFNDNIERNYGIRIIYDKDDYTYDLNLEPYLLGGKEDLYIAVKLTKEDGTEPKELDYLIGNIKKDRDRLLGI